VNHTKIEDKSRLEIIDIVKTLALFFVVLGHAANAYTGEYVINSLRMSSFFHSLTLYLYSFHIPLFIFASGYIYYYCKKERGKYSNFIELFEKKAKRLLIPFVTVSLLFTLPIRFLLGFHPQSQKYLEFMVHNLIYPLNNLWFLLALFVVFVLFYALEPVVNKIHWSLSVILFVTIFFVASSPAYYWNIFMTQSAFGLLIYFYLGYLFREKKITIGEKTIFPVICVGVTHFLLFQITLFNRLQFNPNLILAANLVKAVLGILFVLSLCNYAFSRGGLLKNRYTKMIEKRSFGIYLFHEPIIFLVLIVVLPKLWSPLLVVFMALTISVIVSIIITILLEKNKHTKGIVGG